VGGGLIVISTGWALLKQSYDEDPKRVKKNIQPTDPFHNAFYPLTLAMLGIQDSVPSSRHTSNWLFIRFTNS
jgi:hypothetical protein